MSHISLPPTHRKILRKVFTYINQLPTQRSALTTLPGTAPSLRLGETLIMEYKRRTHPAPKTPPNTRSSKPSHLPTGGAVAPAPTTPPPQPSSTTTSTRTTLTTPTTLSAVHQRIATCTQCKLHIYRKNPLKLNTQSSLPIMVLLDIVNWSDQLHRKFFTTPDGMLLLKILKALGLNPKEIYFTTTVKCSSAEEISNQLEKFSVCLQHFHAELEILKPKLILAFGEDSYKMLTQQPNFTESMGQLLRYKNSEIIYTHHPKELVNDPTLKKETWEHFKGHLKKIEALRQPRP